MTRALAARHGEREQKLLGRSTVAICGLGGLGSNVAVSLARAGVGTLILADFDKVELTNLNRQQYKISQIGRRKTDALEDNLYEIAPYVKLVTRDGRITADNAAELVRDADVVCEAFDRPEEKAMLVNAVLGAFPEKYLVAASGMAGLGDGNLIKARKITKRFILCGDETSDISDGTGIYASRVALCAASQAHAILRILTGSINN